MIPAHWSFRLWSRRLPASGTFKRVNVGGGHVSTFRRLIRIGPWGFYAMWYRPGWVDENERERLP